MEGILDVAALNSERLEEGPRQASLFGVSGPAITLGRPEATGFQAANTHHDPLQDHAGSTTRI